MVETPEFPIVFWWIKVNCTPIDIDKEHVIADHRNQLLSTLLLTRQNRKWGQLQGKKRHVWSCVYNHIKKLKIK